MDRTRVALAWVVMTLFVVGCSSSATPDAAETSSAATKKVSKAEPAKAVTKFLEAIRAKDDTKARGMLTSLAREKTAKMELVRDLNVSQQATFKIGEVELIEDQGAHVQCTWTDVDEDGVSYSDEIIWVLRNESEGWRVAGMAMRVFPDQPAVILNYEDPDDMVRKQMLVEEEMMRRANEENQQAADPGAASEKTSR